MNKSPDAFRTISEVSDWLDTPTYVLRFWESRFSQIKPVKRAGGRRYYRPEDMLLLGGIKKLLHFDGHTIKGVQSLIKENGAKHVAAFSPALDEQVVSPVPKDEEPKIDMASIVKAGKAKPEQNPKVKPLQLKAAEESPAPTPVSNPAPTPTPAEPEAAKPVARAVKVTVHKKASLAGQKTAAKVEVAAETPVPFVMDIPNDRLIAGPFLVGTARSYNKEEFQSIETLYYSLKMVRNNMKRAHAAR